MAKIYAHRGSSGQYPENTMLAFQKAVQCGCDGIENDVHLSKDGEVMIIHDESLLRTCGIEKNVWDLTRSELEKTNAGKTQSDAFGFTPVPSLDEYLSFMEDHRDMVTNIELKTAPVYYPGLEEKVLDLVARHGLEDNVIYSSFNWLSVLRMKALNPSCRIGLLFSGLKLYNLASLMEKMDVDCFHPDFQFTDSAFVENMHSFGRLVNVWTVNEEKDIETMLSIGVDGIITNWPQRAMAKR